ncbi:MAG: hypothetical protein ABI566_10120 [Pseudolysinimonas sp.]
MGASTRRALVLVGAAAVVAALTALVFLVRAGGDPADAATWPITWELRSSDNGPLFQFLHDVVAGRALDWSFSPQVFVFPELPISAIAFAVTGGSIYGYYLVVAMLNNALLFVVLVGLSRVLFPGGSAVLRAAIATTPLLVLPLIGTSWILSFHLAPTYYFGMYAALLAAPLLVLSTSRAATITIGVALALTAASNPLALLFAAPATAVTLLVVALRHGARAVRRPVVIVAGTLLLALVLRLVFSPLQGTSPFTYVDPEVFATRLSQIGPYFAFEARDLAAAAILTTGLVLAVVCLATAIVAAVLYARGRTSSLAVVYLGLIPLGGVAATFALMITHYLYFWPVLILPFVLVLLAVPRGAVPVAAASAALVLFAVGLATGAANFGTVDRYFGYRTPETVCLDEFVPGQLGYATFSDSRRLSLTSATGMRLIQIESSLEPSHWLTNRAYPTGEAGTFFYVNDHGDERPVDALAIESRFGEPDGVVACDDGQSLLIYGDPAKLDLIAEFYGVAPKL